MYVTTVTCILSPCYISLDGQLSFHPGNVLFAHVFMLVNKILLLLTIII